MGSCNSRHSVNRSNSILKSDTGGKGKTQVCLMLLSLTVQVVGPQLFLVSVPSRGKKHQVVREIAAFIQNKWLDVGMLGGGIGKFV